MAFEEDLSVFFDDFGVGCMTDFQDAGRADFSFEGIFEDPYAATQLGTYRVLISEPTLLVQMTPEVQRIAKNDQIMVDGAVYHALSPAEDDGTGVARIRVIAATPGGDDTTLTPDEEELMT